MGGGVSSVQAQEFSNKVRSITRMGGGGDDQNNGRTKKLSKKRMICPKMITFLD